MNIFNYRKISDKCSEYVFYDVPVDFVNKLRRIILREIEAWAIEYVSFEINTSQFPDEIIAHRLALCPIKNLSQNSEVISFNLVGYQNIYSHYFNTDNLKFDDNIYICPLFSNEEIKGIFTVSQGTAKEHAKWQSADSWLSINDDFPESQLADDDLLNAFDKTYSKYLQTSISSSSQCISLFIESYLDLTPNQILTLSFDKFILSL